MASEVKQVVRHKSEKRIYEKYQISGIGCFGCRRLIITNLSKNRVGGYPLIEQPTSHTTVRTVRYTAVQ